MHEHTLVLLSALSLSLSLSFLMLKIFFEYCRFWIVLRALFVSDSFPLITFLNTLAESIFPQLSRHISLYHALNILINSMILCIKFVHQFRLVPLKSLAGILI